jgi:Lipocalin-like domain
MQTRSLLSFICLSFLLIFTHCGKDKDDSPSGKTKKELLTQASWKYEKVDPALAENFVPACLKDNTITFTADGHGTSPDIGTICDPATSTTFDWNFTSGEAKLHISTGVIPGSSPGDFDIVTLNETNLVVSQSVTNPLPATITVTFKH